MRSVIILLHRARALFSPAVAAIKDQPEQFSDDLASTSPDSLTELRLQFSTPMGPRTVCVPRVPLRDASMIVAAMHMVGYDAAVIGDRNGKPMAAHIKALKRKAARARSSEGGASNLLPFKKLSKGKTHGRISGGERSA